MQCRKPGCGQQIIIGETTRGRRIALNAHPDHGGTYALRPVAFGLPLVEYVKPEPLPEIVEGESNEHEQPAASLYVVHAATCGARGPKPVRGWRGRQQTAQTPPQPLS